MLTQDFFSCQLPVKIVWPAVVQQPLKQPQYWRRVLPVLQSDISMSYLAGNYDPAQVTNLIQLARKRSSIHTLPLYMPSW